LEILSTSLLCLISSPADVESEVAEDTTSGPGGQPGDIGTLGTGLSAELEKEEVRRESRSKRKTEVVSIKAKASAAEPH
jgi:hypothetical protein